VKDNQAGQNAGEKGVFKRAGLRVGEKREKRTIYMYSEGHVDVILNKAALSQKTVIRQERKDVVCLKLYPLRAKWIWARRPSWPLYGRVELVRMGVPDPPPSSLKKVSWGVVLS